MSYPRFVKLKPGDTWTRVDNIVELALNVDGNGIWHLSTDPSGSGEDATFSTETAARKVLGELLGLLGSADVTD